MRYPLGITCGSPRTGASAAGGSCDLTLPGKTPGNLAPPTLRPALPPAFPAPAVPPPSHPALIAPPLPPRPTALSGLAGGERRRGGRAAVPQELRAALRLV